jgi:hypothetical protein
MQLSAAASLLKYRRAVRLAHWRLIMTAGRRCQTSRVLRRHSWETHYRECLRSTGAANCLVERLRGAGRELPVFNSVGTAVGPGGVRFSALTSRAYRWHSGAIG